MTKPLLKEHPFIRWGLLGGLHYLLCYAYYRCRFWFLFRRVNKRERGGAHVLSTGVNEVDSTSKRH
jgi:hypothetical protein